MVRLRNFSSITATGSFRLMLSVISSLEQRRIARPDRTNKKIKLCRRYFILSIDSVAFGSTRGTFHLAVEETMRGVFGSFAPPFRREVFIRTEERLFGKMIYDTDWQVARVRLAAFDIAISCVKKERKKKKEGKLGVARIARTAECGPVDSRNFLRHRYLDTCRAKRFQISMRRYLMK